MTLPLSDATGITTSCTVSEKLRDENAGSFCGDSELLLDRMLEQCQTRPTARHPGFGRKLVPYFDDSEPLEKANKAKGEGCYVRGTNKGGGYRRNSPRSSRRMSGRGYCHDELRGRRSHVRLDPPVGSVTLLSKKEEGGEVGYAFQSANVCSLFAGPICFNSPPPEALPMPTAVLLAKAMCLS